MKIAIVGAGISGLTVAHLLQREHELTVFEAGAYAGGHTNTIRVDTPTRRTTSTPGSSSSTTATTRTSSGCWRGSASPSQPSTMSFAVTDEARRLRVQQHVRSNGLFAKRAHLTAPWFHRMLADVVRFQRAARELLAAHGAGPVARPLGRGAALLAPVHRPADRPAGVRGLVRRPAPDVGFPARFLAEFFDNHGMLGLRDRPRWRTVAGGSARYVEALVAPVAASACGCPRRCEAIARHDDHVLVRARGGEPERFDEVVVATHSDQALRMLADASDREHELLGAIPYQPNEAVLHTDTPAAAAPPPRVGELELPPARRPARQDAPSPTT